MIGFNHFTTLKLSTNILNYIDFHIPNVSEQICLSLFVPSLVYLKNRVHKICGACDACNCNTQTTHELCDSQIQCYNWLWSLCLLACTTRMHIVIGLWCNMYYPTHYRNYSIIQFGFDCTYICSLICVSVRVCIYSTHK